MTTELKELIFIRHGSVPEKFNKSYIGQDDVPLSETGILECEATGRFLASLAIDKAYCGNLKRVTQTVEAVRRFTTNIPEPCVDSRLNEIDFGDWGMKSFEEVAQMDPEGYANWSLGYFDYTFPHGESVANFAKRTREFLEEILAQEGFRIAIFSHGGVIMSLISDMIGNHRDNAFNIWVERGGIAKVKVRDDGTARLSLILKPSEFEI